MSERNIRFTKEPKREPDLVIKETINNYGAKFWYEEDVLTLCEDDDGDHRWHPRHYKTYSLVNTDIGLITPREWIIKVLNDTTHDHHRVVAEYCAERILLGKNEV